MLDYHPKFALATLSPPQTALVPKFGGLPWGLPLAKWPVCQQCGVPMALLAQLPHDPPRLDLGDPKWVLHLFLCPGQGELQTYTFCDFWDWDAGANAAFVVDRAELGHGLVTNRDQSQQHGEVFLTGWIEREDCVPKSEAEAYRDPKRWSQLPDEVQVPDDFETKLRTKFGGAPYWTGNGPMSFPDSPYQFAFQIGSNFQFDDRLPKPDDVGCRVWDTSTTRPDGATDFRDPSPGCEKPNAPWYLGSDSREAGLFWVNIANFCSDGTAYIYLDRTADPPRAGMFINR